MILIVALATWMVALAVVAGLCIAACRGDSQLGRDLLDSNNEDRFAGVLDVAGTVSAGERRPGSVSRRPIEHERARIERVAVS